MMRATIGLAVLFCFAAMLAAGTASADPVWVGVPRAEKGQGWLFAVPDSKICAVVTAAHVVQGVDPAKIVIVGRRQAEATVTAIKILSPPRQQSPDGLDVALLYVGGPLAQSGCTSAIMSPASLTFAYDRTESGTIELMADNDSLPMDVDFIATRTSGPQFIAFAPHNPNNAIQQGNSGAAILNPPSQRTGPGAPATPLAMVINGGNNGEVPMAVKYDAIWSLVRGALLSAPAATQVAVSARAGSGGGTVADWSGQTVRPDCPPGNAILPASACGWIARPLDQSHSIGLVIALAGADPTVSGFSLQLANGPSGARAIVEVDPGDGSWTFVQSCSLAGTQATCRFAQRNARRLRVSLADPDGAALELRLGDIVK